LISVALKRTEGSPDAGLSIYEAKTIDEYIGGLIVLKYINNPL
jgi:hypothetical protein